MCGKDQNQHSVELEGCELVLVLSCQQNDSTSTFSAYRDESLTPWFKEALFLHADLIEINSYINCNAG